MAIKPVNKATPKNAPPATSDKNAATVKIGTHGVDASMTYSEMLAVLVTESSLSAYTLQQYAGAGDKVELADLMAEMKKKGDAVVGGDLTLIERMLVSQAITLDAMFHNLAQRLPAATARAVRNFAKQKEISWKTLNAGLPRWKPERVPLKLH